MRLFFIICFILFASNNVSANVLGKVAFEQMERARLLFEADKIDAAQKLAGRIITNPRHSDYERAIARQLRASIYAAAGDYTAALKDLRAIEQESALPQTLRGDALYHRARLNLSAGDAAAALRLYEKWVSGVEHNKLQAPAFALAAYIHFALEDWGAVQTSIGRAVEKYEQDNGNKPPPKNWLQMLAATHLMEEDYAAARDILERAAAAYATDKNIWLQLAGVYQRLGDNDKAFATYESLAQQGGLEASAELVRLAQFYLNYRAPIKAARLLEAGLGDERIERSAQNYALLASAYQQAQEWQKSLAPLAHASKIATDPADKSRYAYRLGIAYFADERWGKAAEFFERVVETELEEKDYQADAWLRLGLAYRQLGRAEDALAALRRAGEDDELAEQAYQWIRVIEKSLRNKE